MPQVKLAMTAAGLMRLVGHIFRLPRTLDDTPVDENAVVQTAKAWQKPLPDGNYQYEFDVPDGNGKFSLTANGHGKGDFDTAVQGHTGLLYPFEAP